MLPHRAELALFRFRRDATEVLLVRRGGRSGGMAMLQVGRLRRGSLSQAKPPCVQAVEVDF